MTNTRKIVQQFSVNLTKYNMFLCTKGLAYHLKYYNELPEDGNNKCPAAVRPKGEWIFCIFWWNSSRDIFGMIKSAISWVWCFFVISSLVNLYCINYVFMNDGRVQKILLYVFLKPHGFAAILGLIWGLFAILYQIAQIPHPCNCGTNYFVLTTKMVFWLYTLRDLTSIFSKL